MNSILVLCEGNICRSPMAEGILRHSMPELTVTSAGLGALIGSPADETAVALLAAKGIDITRHRAAQVTRPLCLAADIILVMETAQRTRLERLYPEVCGRVFRVAEFSQKDVPDPYRQQEQAFRTALEVIEEGLSAWLSRLNRISKASA